MECVCSFKPAKPIKQQSLDIYHKGDENFLLLHLQTCIRSEFLNFVKKFVRVLFVLSLTSLHS